jgi:hypothetical protein
LELEKINSRDALIATVLWYINTELADNGDHITLQSVLRATLDDIHQECSIIDFWRRSQSSTHLVSISMPDELFDAIIELSKEKFIFIFTKKNGGPLKPEQVLKNFKITGKRAGIPQKIWI